MKHELMKELKEAIEEIGENFDHNYFSIELVLGNGYFCQCCRKTYDVDEMFLIEDLNEVSRKVYEKFVKGSYDDYSIYHIELWTYDDIMISNRKVSEILEKILEYIEKQVKEMVREVQQWQ